MKNAKPVLCIVGLGYVGLPLAHGFAKAGFTVMGYDINAERIAELRAGRDRTNELSPEELQEVTIAWSHDPAIIRNADVVIVALPTPVDDTNTPDLTILKAGTATVGKHLKRGAIVVFESTVYPGTTEDICGPILEQGSGMTCGKDFTLGYSPERINPGDREHRLATIVKVVAGQDMATLNTLCALYGAVVKAGIHAAPSIKVAEMAKAIENAQRDLNIAYVNEIAMLCKRMGISSKDVLDAAATKWNFLRFTPGLVGGHCIGVDPYYLVEKARQLGMQTHIISAGRLVNDGMAAFVAREIHAVLGGAGKRVLVLGLTFKENVPDTRNSKSGEVVNILMAHGHEVSVHDPLLQAEDLPSPWKPGDLSGGPFDAVILLVPHAQYRALGTERILSAVKPGGLVYDLKAVLDGCSVERSGRIYRTL